MHDFQGYFSMTLQEAWEPCYSHPSSVSTASHTQSNIGRSLKHFEIWQTDRSEARCQCTAECDWYGSWFESYQTVQFTSGVQNTGPN